MYCLIHILGKGTGPRKTMDTYLSRFYHDSCEFIVRKGASKHSISQKLNISEQWGIKWLF